MIQTIYKIGLFLLLISNNKLSAQTHYLREKILQIISTNTAEVGVSIVGLESKDTLTINNSKHYPLQSVFKFHIALAILNRVDKRKLSLSQKLYINKSDLLENTWSPLRETYPNGNIKIPLSAILRYTISETDNNGCDILLRLLGGAKIVDRYVHKMGITNFTIAVTEEEMHKEWEAQFANWTTPKSVSDLLLLFYSQNLP